MGRFDTMEAEVSVEKSFSTFSDASTFAVSMEEAGFDLQGVEKDPYGDGYKVRFSVVGTVNWERRKEW